MYDPNWFYSSLAQCAAALVGLIGAVLATRLQSQFIEFRRGLDALRTRFAGLRDEFVRRASDVARYGYFADERIAAMRSVAATGGSQMNVTSETHFWGGGSSGSLPPVAVTQDTIKAYEQRKTLVDPTVRSLHAPFSAVADRERLLADLFELEAQMPEDVLPTLQEIRLRLHQFSSDAAAHERTVFASIRVPTVLALILGWLCFFGLIAPLWYLSAYTSLSKAILLAGFSLGVSALPVYIAIEIIGIYRLRRL
jgi:hypothetical protein